MTAYCQIHPSIFCYLHTQIEYLIIITPCRYKTISTAKISLLILVRIRIHITFIQRTVNI